jgi:hypothetical protein
MIKKQKRYSFGLSQLRKKTPIMLFKLGNTILTLSTFITTYEFYQNDTRMALYSLVAGVVGKTLTELFGHND